MSLAPYSPHLFFATTDDGTVLEVNESLCHHLQYTAGELLQQKQELLFTLPTRIFQQTHFFPLLKLQGFASEIFITLRNKEGDPVPVLMNAERRLIADRHVCLYAGIVVENRKKFEEELIAARNLAEKALHENEALQQARKQLMERAEVLEKQMQIVARQNEEMRQFNRVVTHDLREPLRKLALFTSLLVSGQSIAQEQNTIDKIHKNLAQLSSTIGGLQRYVWLHEATLNLQQIEVDALVQQAAQQVQTDWPGINLQWQMQGSGTIQADWEQLHVLVYELLANAVRFRQQPDQVEVTIKVTTVPLNLYQQVEDTYQYADFLRLQVYDTGIGFVGEYSNQVFDLFKKLHPQSGRGIGLSLCKLVVQNHGGRIELDSMPGVGTTVTVHLPLQPAAKLIKQEAV